MKYIYEIYIYEIYLYHFTIPYNPQISWTRIIQLYSVTEGIFVGAITERQSIVVNSFACLGRNCLIAALKNSIWAIVTTLILLAFTITLQKHP